jgi:hypothetical protein
MESTPKLILDLDQPNFFSNLNLYHTIIRNPKTKSNHQFLLFTNLSLIMQLFFKFLNMQHILTRKNIQHEYYI